MDKDAPIVFISHFAIKEGHLDTIREMSRTVGARMRAEKPRTLVWLSYLNKDATRVSFIHVFADRAAMDAHNEGAAERSQAAYEHVTPLGWELYGAPSQEALNLMRHEAESAGVSLRIEPDQLGGFLRLRDAP
jgi:quinol monooxygenase YgiN